MIILPQRRFVEGEMPELKIGIEGWFTARAIRRSGLVTRERRWKVTREQGPWHNLITNYGMDGFGSRANPYRYCQVGTGTATPDVTDTSLANYLGSVTPDFPNSSSGYVGDPDYYAWRTITWTSDIGEFGTVNLTELGVGQQEATGNLWSRELFRDGGGTPTAFPLDSDEQIQITYEGRIFIPVSDQNFTDVLVGANLHDVMVRPSNAATTGSNGWDFPAPGGFNPASSLAVIGAFPGGTNGYTGAPVAFDAASAPGGSTRQPTSASSGSYVDGNYYRDSSITWGSGNPFVDLQTIRLNFISCAFQMQYNPVIAKTDTQQLILNQRLSWVRH